MRAVFDCVADPTTAKAASGRKYALAEIVTEGGERSVVAIALLPEMGNKLANARADTVAEKPAFRSAFKKRRCHFLTDGFYEFIWTILVLARRTQGSRTHRDGSFRERPGSPSTADSDHSSPGYPPRRRDPGGEAGDQERRGAGAAGQATSSASRRA